jgi:6-phosphogluconolactonase (cycloisomerase 2 family)
MRVIALSALVLPLAQGRSGHNGPTLAYVGCYTFNGQGIYLFHADPKTGALTQIKGFQSSAVPPVSTTSPSWLAFDPQKKYMYAANEIPDFSGPFAGTFKVHQLGAPEAVFLAA